MKRIAEDSLVNIQQIILLFVMLIGLQTYHDVKSDEMSGILTLWCNGIFEIFALYFATAYLPVKLKGLVRSLFFIFLLVHFTLNIGCLLSIDSLFGMDQLTMILGTNIHETKEFFSSYLSLPSVLATVIILCGAVILFYKAYWKLKPKKLTIALIGTLFLGSLCFTVLHPNLIRIYPLREFFMLRLYEPTPDLRQYTHNVEVLSSDSLMPQNIVIIVGESFAKSHSSLYGYTMKTNPCLQEMRDKGNLVVYQHVTSTAVSTIPAFKSIFSSYSDGSDGKWYERVTLFDVFRPKYKIYWLSNQNPGGFFDNLLACYVDLADYKWYSDSNGKGPHYDEVLVPELNKALKDTLANKLIIINLMGQHEDFAQRYPSNYKHFKSEDYSSLPVHQRSMVSSYDNATLYNDYVVSELFKSLDGKDALGIYFPDHGLDMYVSSPDYVGHAHKNFPKSYNAGTQIPFVIYSNGNVMKCHPDMVRKIRSNAETALSTDHFIDFLCNILNYKYRVKQP